MGETGATNLMSQSAYADYRGATRQYINRMVKEDVIPGYGPRNQVDRDEADKLLGDHARLARESFTKKNNPSAGLPGRPDGNGDSPSSEADSSDGDIDVADSKALGLIYKRGEAKEKQAKAALAELALARERKELGYVAEFENVAFEKGKEFSGKLDELLNLKAILAAEKSGHKVGLILKAEIDRIKKSLGLPDATPVKQPKKKVVKKNKVKKKTAKKKKAVKKKTKKKAKKKK